MYRVALLVLLVIAVALGATAAATTGRTAGARDRVIAFSSTRGGPDPHIYVMRADGGSVRRVTRAHGDEPTWSPDGRRIAFSRVYDTPSFVGSSIWTIGPDGRNERRLTRDRELQWEPDWSPDGRRIAFEAGVRDGAIAVVPSGGGRRRLLTSGSGHDHSPAWSPDGRQIAFSRGMAGRADIFVMSSGGGAVRRLRSHAGADLDPAWSPDGRWIAFGSDAGATGFHVFVMRSDGTDLRRLTSKRGGQPSWSPDGERIVFASSRSGAPELLVIDVDTGRERRLTRNAVVDVRPDWRG